MAIISIPTSIGGVSIPGGLFKGPLGKLYGKKGSEQLQYPEDIASNPTRQHSVVITIKKVQAAASTEKVGKVIDDVKGGVVKNIQSTLKPPISDIASTITLYMPDTLNMQYSASYQEFSLTDALGTKGRIAQTAMDAFDSAKSSGGWKDSAKNLATGAAGVEVAGKLLDKKAGTSGASDILLKSTGQAVNPQLQLLFKGVALRTFQLDFIFTPKSKYEAESVKKIIDTLTLHFHPELVGAAKGNEGQYFVMPSIFNIDFKFSGSDGTLDSVLNSVLGNLGVVGAALAPLLPGSAGKENKNLFKVGECVLESINVDYAPNGWTAHTDGAPVQTKLTLQFKEMDIVHRQRLINGVVR